MATKAQVKRRLELLDKSGRGTGWGAAYRPLFRVHEAVSLGLVHRFACLRYDNRQFNLLSNAEKACFLWYWFQPDTVEIYDQTKCEREGTRAIAKLLGVRHPEVVRGEAGILSNDLLIVRRVPGGFREHAISIKHAGCKLTDADRKSLLIQRLYNLQRGREWTFCSSAGMNTTWAKNLQWLFPAAEYVDRGFVTISQLAAEEAVLSELRHAHLNAAEALRAATVRFNLPATAAAGAFRRLIATRVLEVDINAPAFDRLPPSAFRIRRNASAFSAFSENEVR